MVGRSEELLVGKKDADGGGDNQQAQHQRAHQFDQRDATSALQRLRKSFAIHIGTLLRTLVVTCLRALFAPSTPSSVAYLSSHSPVTLKFSPDWASLPQGPDLFPILSR